MTDAADPRPAATVAQVAARLGTSAGNLRALVRTGMFTEALDGLPWRLSDCDPDEPTPDDEDE